MSGINIREMLATDWEFVANIYQEGIATGIATFETGVPTLETWDKAHMNSCRFVAISNNENFRLDCPLPRF